jgi:hypothetical protein
MKLLFKFLPASIAYEGAAIFCYEDISSFSNLCLKYHCIAELTSFSGRQRIPLGWERPMADYRENPIKISRCFLRTLHCISPLAFIPYHGFGDSTEHHRSNLRQLSPR